MQSIGTGNNNLEILSVHSPSLLIIFKELIYRRGPHKIGRLIAANCIQNLVGVGSGDYHQGVAMEYSIQQR
ncbi:hypothetical protein M1N66_02960 [Thermodesulfovibrionales bacterium]|nr:hypothetical protein [Thermodesulfovibrionales bacterium]